MKKIAILSVSLIGVIFLAGCGQKTVVQNPEPKTQPPVQNIETPSKQTYQNAKYGFEFQYPKEVKIQEQGDTVKITYSIDQENGKIESGWEINAFSNSTKKNLGDWFFSNFDQKQNKDCKEADSNIIVAGAYTKLFSADSMEGACNDGGYYTSSPDRSVIAEWKLGQDAMYSEEIIQSFKFKNQ